MSNKKNNRFTWRQPTLLAILVLCLGISGEPVSQSGASDEERSVYIVRASSIEAAAATVTDAGGLVIERLGIINAVGAAMTEAERLEVASDDSILGVHSDARLQLQSSLQDTHYPRQVGARKAHKKGHTGKNVTIAVLDTGLWQSSDTKYDTRGRRKVSATYDATAPSWFTCDDDDYDDEDDCYSGFATDWNGHGTHITSIMAGSDEFDSNAFNGVAPDANIVAVKAFEADGSGTYLDVIKALDWIVRNRKRYKIRVLNLSFGAPAASHYWDDPVNLAVMSAWQSGITVVAAAGNGGPGPMTIGVPGNVPYIITVGAYTDNFTPYDDSDDRLARFSAAGPTIEGFVKPDLVAPGGHMLGTMPPYAYLPLQYPEYVQRVGDSYSMSGTSQASAVVSGIVALMLEEDRKLSPDDVKCRLLATARPAHRPDGEYAYSVFQQGAGKVDADAAMNSPVKGCANNGLDIDRDLDGTQHYAGPAGVDMDGSYYVVDADGNRVGGSGYEWLQGVLWPEGAFWTEGALWNNGHLWNTSIDADDAVILNPDSLLSQGLLWPEGTIWPEGLTRPVNTYLWVEQE